MSYNTQNYAAQGGDEWVINGTLTDNRFGEAGARATTVEADVLAIPVTHRFVTKNLGSDGEALTLADGVPGQVLTITVGAGSDSPHGTGTLTPATSAGFASVALADVGDTVTLEFVDSTTGWVVIGAAGVSAPPAIALS